MEQDSDRVPVLVPTHLEAAVLRFVADQLEQEGGGGEAQAEWDEERLRGLATHPNEDLRNFLRYLAERSPEWVPAVDAMKAAGKDMRGAGGFLGRVNVSSKKRFGLPLPIKDRRRAEPGKQQKGRPPLQYRIDDEDVARLYLKVSAE